jgi:hypothetical protein
LHERAIDETLQGPGIEERDGRIEDAKLLAQDRNRVGSRPFCPKKKREPAGPADERLVAIG